MNIGWPEGIWIGLSVFALIVGAMADGMPKTGNHKFALVMLNVILSFGLLWWGGFFA